MAAPIVWTLLAAGAYLLGTFPTAILIGKSRGVDPTTQGSGNPGASNVYRTAGRTAGLVTALGDIAKGAIGAAVGWVVDGRQLGFVCLACAVLGHMFPVMRRFRGGKGVATTAGGVLVLDPIVGVLTFAAFALVTRSSRKASLGSLAACVLVPSLAGLFGAPSWETWSWIGICGFVLVRHHANIKRLIRGEERTISSGGRSAPGS